MDDRLAPVKELFFVDVQAFAREIPALAAHHRRFEDVAPQLVDVELRVLCDGRVAKARGRALLREQHVEHERIFAVFVKSALRIFGVIFAGVDDMLLVDELRVVQRRSPV